MVESLAAVDQVIARHQQELALPGVLTARAGYKFKGGWAVSPPTPAIVVTVAAKSPSPPGGRSLPTSVEGIPVDVRQASPRKRAQLREPAANRDRAPDSGAVPEFGDETSPHGARLTSAAADASAAAPAVAKPQLPYVGPSGVTLDPVTGPVTVRACASPDAGWPVLQAFLAGVTDTLTIGLYDWTAAHVLDWFIKQTDGKTISLLLDHPSQNPTADQTDEETVGALTKALGDNLTQAWALERSDPLATAWQFPSAYHIKVAVADHARVWLSSGNWNNSNQPDIDPVTLTGDAVAARGRDRDWHVVIESPQLAGVFEAYLANDLAVAQQHQRPTPSLAVSVAAPQSGEQTPPFAQFWGPTTVSGTMTITPVLTPDDGSYATHVQELIASARSSLDMQFQYIELPKDPASESAAFAGLIAAVVDRQRSGVAVRIVMSEFETQGYLEKLMAAGLDVANCVKIQSNVHNKGIVVDGATVLVASQNWSNAGTTQNRDAGVIIANPSLAQYFGAIFEHDWTTLAAHRAAED